MHRITLLVSICLISSACSVMIANSGVDTYRPEPNQDRAKTHQTLGEPDETYFTEKGELIEAYKQHGKVKSYDRSVFHAMWLFPTLGAWELIALPYELLMLPIDTLREHYLYVPYNQQGNAIVGEHSYLAPDEHYHYRRPDSPKP